MAKLCQQNVYYNANTYYNALVFLSFCYFKVKIHSLFIFSFLLLLFVFTDYVSNTIYSTCPAGIYLAKVNNSKLCLHCHHSLLFILIQWLQVAEKTVP